VWYEGYIPQVRVFKTIFGVERDLFRCYNGWDGRIEYYCVFTTHPKLKCPNNETLLCSMAVNVTEETIAQSEFKKRYT
jgi:hypothetical protein